MQTIGPSLRTASRACAPSSAVPRTVKPDASRYRVRQSRIGGWSSATTHVVFARFLEGVTSIVTHILGSAHVRDNARFVSPALTRSGYADHPLRAAQWLMRSVTGFDAT